MSQPADPTIAWKNAAYRDALSPEARQALPPHPAGDIEFEDAVVGGFGFESVANAMATESLLTLGCCRGITADAYHCWGFTEPLNMCTVACISIVLPG